MLISCPKCHSLYEIPDDLIPKTGQNFRCQACHNVWHALPQDALGYEEEKDIKPIIDEIITPEPPYRNYPANKEHFEVPLDSKSGKKNISSKDLIKNEGDTNFVPPAPKNKKELTLRSESGAFFTISLDKDLDDENIPYFNSYEETTNQTNTQKNTTPPQTKRKHYILAKLGLFILFILTISILLRRDIVTLFPQTETYYNKIFLSGLNNPEYLVFEKINIEETNSNETKLDLTIKNNSRYNTYLPSITINDKEIVSLNNKLLKAKETTQITLPLELKDNTTNYILKFKRK